MSGGERCANSLLIVCLYTETGNSHIYLKKQQK